MKKIAIVLLAALMLLAISCDEQPQHEHKFSEEWKSNETQHWHECECQEKSGVADHDYETITVESTCSKKGSETVKCKVCGYVNSTKELELKAHTPAEEHDITDSTCSEEGSDVVKCAICGEVVSSKVIEKKAHTPAEEHDITDSTCSEEGSDVVKCTVCGEVVSSKVIEKKEHTPAEKHVIVAPSCSEFGSDSTVCSDCNEVIEATYSAKKEHTTGASQVVKPATCSEEGLEVVICTECEEVISSKPIACISHTWEDWDADKESVLKTRNCSKCNATETSGSVVLTPKEMEKVMEVAMAYDKLIDSVLYNDVSGVAFIEKENRILSTDKLLYDFKNFESHKDGNCSCEIKLSNEEAYHHYSFIMDNYEGTISDVSIDGVKQGEEYVVNNDPYIIAFKNYRKSGLEMVMHFNVKDAEVKNAEEVTYNISFESDYDPSRSYETRYMKIVDVDGKIKLEYTMKVIGLNAFPVSISSALKNLEMGVAVGVFTVDGKSYDIDYVNAAITKMPKPTV